MKYQEDQTTLCWNEDLERVILLVTNGARKPDKKKGKKVERESKEYIPRLEPVFKDKWSGPSNWKQSN